MCSPEHMIQPIQKRSFFDEGSLIIQIKTLATWSYQKYRCQIIIIAKDVVYHLMIPPSIE